MAVDVARYPYRQTVTLEKYIQRPAEGPPDEVIETEEWFEADGAPVTDPARIAQLEAGIPQEEQHGENA